MEGLYVYVVQIVELYSQAESHFLFLCKTLIWEPLTPALLEVR